MPGIVKKHGNVLYLGGEDGNGSIRYRLERVGADLNKVFLVEDEFDCMDGLLAGMIENYSPVLVIFDALLSYWPEKLDPNRQPHCRKVMNYLRNLARNYGTCILCVIHPSKKEDYRLIHRYAGSGAFVDSVRSALYIGYHPTDSNKRVGIQAKHNTTDCFLPFIFSVDSERGFVWHGSDEEITVHDVETAIKRESERTSKDALYKEVLKDVLEQNPTGLDCTAKEILELYGKNHRHDIDVKSFGHAISGSAIAFDLKQAGIVLEKSANTGNRQRYKLNYIESVMVFE